MKKLILYFTLFILVLTSCKKPIEKANETFTNEGPSFLGNDIAFFSSSIDFYEYGDLSNYWYSDDTTYSEVLDDKYHKGYRGLTKLNEEVKKLDSKDDDIFVAVNDLRKQITIAKEDLKKKQKLIEGLDVFGGLLFDSSDILQRNNSLEKEKDRQIPLNVKNSFDKLIKLLRFKYTGVAESIFNLERRAYFIAEPDDIEKNQIRVDLKLYIQNEINKHYIENSKSKIEMLNFLFKILEKEHPINSTN